MCAVRSICCSLSCCRSARVEEPESSKPRVIRTAEQLVQLAIQMKNSGNYFGPFPVSRTALQVQNLPNGRNIPDHEVTNRLLNHRVFVEKAVQEHPESTVHEVIYEDDQLTSAPRPLEATVSSLWDDYQWMKFPQDMNPGKDVPEMNRIMVIRYAKPH